MVSQVNCRARELQVAVQRENMARLSKKMTYEANRIKFKFFSKMVKHSTRVLFDVTKGEMSGLGCL